MNDKTTTTAADQRGPNAPSQEVGLSSLVKAELDKLGGEKKARILEHVSRKG